MSAVAESGLMPLVSNPRRKADGTSGWTENDRVDVDVFEGGYQQKRHIIPFFELERNGGIRRHQHFAFPTTVYQAYADASTQGRTTIRSQVAQNERHRAELEAAGWFTDPTQAKDVHERGQEAIAESAARAAFQAERMTEPAKRQYQRRSATDPNHVTE